ncbi:flagellar filament capping protein FliD [Jeotgalibaca arthritidis]|uniref:Flagellar hook-associated protein 2 n=1 Tax=Jeotgalibaca arthritidis TaxID=1868794 RepID=A0A6G7K9S7_9LACT|nr:flagellar filament capping protein FliD [Jeotgalibaca arthritidis]QII81961.1 flagellar filament capping protein FliD [Jeotgalibaca arthritidis]
MSSNSINILGTYSGITMDTIEQLLSAESTKLTSYKNEQAAVEKEKSAWKDVQTRITNLATKMDALKQADTFNAKKATLSQEGKIGFTVGSKAIAGDYSITVKQLATRTEIKGKELQLDENKTWQKEGPLTFQTTNEAGEVKQLDIKIEAGDNLEKIVNKINDATKETGVSAVAIDGHLVLQNKAFGASNIEVVGELASEFGFLDNEAKTMGKVAELTINGIDIERNSNQISDVMDGVTLDLKEVTSQAIKVEIADDLGKTETAVKGFVDQYNSTMSFISGLLSVGDPSQENNETGALAGDSSLIRLQSQLRSLLTNAVDNGNAGANTVKSIGIEVDRDGVASFDADKLKEALKEDSSKVRDLFTFTKTSVNAAGETVEEEIGIGQKFESLINSFTDSKDGIIATKNATYDKLIKDITERITVFNDRLETKRQQYIAKFTALDVAMMEAESQLSYMMSQFSNSSSSNS